MRRGFLSNGRATVILALMAALGPLSARAQDAADEGGAFPFMKEDTPAKAAVSRDPAEDLARNLRILAASPRNRDALVGAGKAALAVGDVQASLGFWSRAEEVSPRDGQVKAGLATAFLQSQQPRLALRLFNDAAKLGYPEAPMASDRGFARDLLGDNRRAQRDYAIALQAGADPETTRRLALSLAITGDTALALGTLDPLLRDQDGAAWRARVFVSAITGDIADATAMARALLPARQAEMMVPFLARLADLRPAQQAAAVHFGNLPAVGKADRDTVTVAEGTIKPTVTPAPAPGLAKPGTTVWRAPAILPAAPPPASIAQPSLAVTTVGPVLAEAPAPEAAPPVVIAAAVAKPEPPVEKPKVETKPKPEPKAKPKPPPEKPRVWVQVAGGANRSTLDREWDKLVKAAPDLYRRRQPHVIDIGATNRLVVGPFASKAEAQAYVNQLARSGRSGFRVESAKGQKVSPLK